MAILTITELGQTAVNLGTLTAADATGDQYPNDDRTFFVMDNADASPHTGTIAATRSEVQTPDGFGTLAITDISVVVPAGERRFVRAPIGSHSDASGRVTVTYDAVTSVTVAAVRLARN